jgi:hypothetical protein
LSPKQRDLLEKIYEQWGTYQVTTNRYSEVMATVLPPPSKRQRTEAAERSRAQQDIEEVPSDAGSLRLQFYDETTGLPIGQGPVLVPVADATPKNLELLLNTLARTCEHLSLPASQKILG